MDKFPFEKLSQTRKQITCRNYHGLSKSFITNLPILVITKSSFKIKTSKTYSAHDLNLPIKSNN